MPRARSKSWIAIVSIAGTYFYFLLFAEFALIELAGALRVGADGLRIVMASLGGCGILGAAGAALLCSGRAAQPLLGWAWRGCALGAGMAVAARATGSPALMIAAAAVTGLALGALTVSLAARLRAGLGEGRLGLGIGLGTGTAYALCNVPTVFHASPAAQALLAGAVAAAGSLLPALSDEAEARPTSQRIGWAETVRWLVLLLALVWLDSAAFYIIQHTDALRAETWSDAATLRGNAVMHLAAALFSGWLLDRGRRDLVLAAAVLALAAAGLELNAALPRTLPAGALYTAGVSLYSVALVEWPARWSSPWLGALTFGVAGWVGSALGIGMAQDLTRIPTAFIAGVLAVGVLAVAWRSPRIAVAALVGAVGVTAGRADDVAMGREVYIAEGCIHCHSQYIRPGVAEEVLNWGPSRTLGETRSAAPPLLGTRRQGPDLSQVGNRRSPEWNRLHLMAPQEVSPGSRMPRYDHLFAPGDGRGEALLAYLASLGADTAGQRRETVARWTPASGDVIAPAAAARLYQRLCAQCHGATGRGDGELARRVPLHPPDWSREPWRHVRTDERQAETALSRIIKFGLPGLPMAGHEYLPDQEIVGLARHVQMLHESKVAGASAGYPP